MIRQIRRRMKRVGFDGDGKHSASAEERKKFSRRQRVNKFTGAAMLNSMGK